MYVLQVLVKFRAIYSAIFHLFKILLYLDFGLLVSFLLVPITILSSILKSVYLYTGMQELYLRMLV